MKTFKYKIPRAKYEVEKVNRITGDIEKEELTGQIGGQPASDLEERFANALRKTGGIQSWEFQPTTVGVRNVQGEIRPDFVIYAETPLVVQIDGAFAHKTSEQKAKDEMKDAILYDTLKNYGFLPPIRVPGTFLETPDEARNIAQTIIREGRLI